MTNGGAVRIELSINTKYMPAWGLWEGVRELIQNAKDGETQLSAKMTVEHDAATDTLTITNEGATLPHEALLLGHTTKLGDKNTIGQFGEGLKIGLLAIVRAGHAVAIRNGGESWTPVMIQSPAFGVEVLAVAAGPRERRVGELRERVREGEVARRRGGCGYRRQADEGGENRKGCCKDGHERCVLFPAHVSPIARFGWNFRGP